MQRAGCRAEGAESRVYSVVPTSPTEKEILNHDLLKTRDIDSDNDGIRDLYEGSLDDDGLSILNL